MPDIQHHSCSDSVFLHTQQISVFVLEMCIRDRTGRAVYIKNWQMHFSVGFLILWMMMKPCAWVMMSQVNILVLNKQGRFLNRQLLYLPVEL